MFPFVKLGDLTLSMTGVGIVLSFFVFVLVVYIVSYQKKLKFSDFFPSVVVLVLLLQLLGKYFFLLFEYKIYFPLKYEEFLFFLPNISGFQYNYVGLLFAFVLFFWWFFSFKVKKLVHSSWRDAIFKAISVSLIPLGIFLLLGDDFVGKVTNSFLSVHPLTEDSNLATFGRIYPVGLFLSIGSFLVILIKRFIDRRKKRQNGLLGISLLLFMISIVLIFQQSTRHIVNPFGITELSNKFLFQIFSNIDIRHYVTRFFAIITLILHFLITKKQKR